MKKLIVFGVLLFGIGSALGVSAPSAMVSVEQHPDKKGEIHAIGLALSGAKQQGYLSGLKDPDKKKKVEVEFRRLKIWSRNLSKKQAALKKQQTRDGFLLSDLRIQNQRLYEECSKSNMSEANRIKDRLSQRIQASKDKELAYNAKYARKNRDLDKRVRARAKKLSSKFTTSVFGKVTIFKSNLLRIVKKIDAELEKRYISIFLAEPGIWRVRARNKLVKGRIVAVRKASAAYKKLAHKYGEIIYTVPKPSTSLYPEEQIVDLQKQPAGTEKVSCTEQDKEIADLKNKISELEKQPAGTEKVSCIEQDNKIKALETQIVDLKKQSAGTEKVSCIEQDNKIKELDKQIVDLKTKLDEAKKVSCTDQDKKIVELENKITESNKQIEELKKSGCATQNKEIVDLKNKITEFNKQIKELEKQIEELKKQVANSAKKAGGVQEPKIVKSEPKIVKPVTTPGVNKRRLNRGRR